MEGRTFSIEVIEMQCAAECDGNAQVTTPVEIEEEYPTTTIETKTNTETNMGNEFEPQIESAYTRRDGVVYVRTTDAATHWLLVAILAMLFLFMVLRCE